MPKVILIWDACEYGHRYYHLEGEAAELAIASAGQYINDSTVPDDAPIHRLNELIDNGDKEGDFTSDKPIPVGDADCIVICGFLP